MKLKYNIDRGQRVKHGHYRIFVPEWAHVWMEDGTMLWIPEDDPMPPGWRRAVYWHGPRCRSVRAFKRYMRRNCEGLPDGTVVTLFHRDYVPKWKTENPFDVSCVVKRRVAK